MGRIGGKLGLVQLGVENEVYLVDIIAYPEALISLKNILENPRLQTVVWDGRMDYCELWHGHGIELKLPVDLQLVRVYERCGGRAGPQGFIMMEGMGKVFSSKPLAVVHSGINQQRFEEGQPADNFIPSDTAVTKLIFVVQEIIKQKHNRDDTEFWVSRPLGQEERDYAAFDILQLRALYKTYRMQLGRLPNIIEESTRYVELSKDARRPSYTWYLEHGILPQEILHSQWSLGLRMTGRKQCGGCARMLHQCSFRCPFERWTNGQLCHTCAKARTWRR